MLSSRRSSLEVLIDQAKQFGLGFQQVDLALGLDQQRQPTTCFGQGLDGKQCHRALRSGPEGLEIAPALTQLAEHQLKQARLAGIDEEVIALEHLQREAFGGFVLPGGQRVH